jgi:hypothetical protein
MLADKGETAYEIKIKSGKDINVTFPEGIITCPKCGKVWFLKRFDITTTDNGIEEITYAAYKA